MQHRQPGREAFLMDLVWLLLPSFPPDVSFMSSCQLLEYCLVLGMWRGCRSSCFLSHKSSFVLSLLFFRSKNLICFHILSTSVGQRGGRQHFCLVKVLEASHSNASSDSVRASLVSRIICVGGFSACSDLCLSVLMREQRKYFGHHFARSGQRDFYFVGGRWSSSHSSSTGTDSTGTDLYIYFSHVVDEEQIIIVLKTDSASLFEMRLRFLLDVTLILLGTISPWSFCVLAVILDRRWSELEQLVCHLWIRAVGKSLAQNLTMKLEQIILAVNELDGWRKEGGAEVVVAWSLVLWCRFKAHKKMEKLKLRLFNENHCQWLKSSHTGQSTELVKEKKQKLKKNFTFHAEGL